MLLLIEKFNIKKWKIERHISAQIFHFGKK